MTNAAETAILQLLFNNTDWAGIGDATGLQGSTAAGSFYLAQFTADPTDSGSVANEATYTGYARLAIARTSGGWTITGNTADNTAAATCAQCTGGSNTITHIAICKAGTASVADLLFVGALDSSIAISNGIALNFAIGEIDCTFD